MEGFHVLYRNGKGDIEKGLFFLKKKYTQSSGNGTWREIAEYQNKEETIGIKDIYVFYKDSFVMEKWVEAENLSQKEVVIEQIDSVCWRIPKGSYTLDYFTTERGGTEFTPARTSLANAVVLEVREGRSSRGMHPWFCLTRNGGGVWICSVAWSGNWIFRFVPQIDGSVELTGGLNDWNFFKELKPGEGIEGAHLLWVYQNGTDVDAAAAQLRTWGRLWCYPQNTISKSIPIEWNHWWPYTDKTITEQTFCENIKLAKELGVDFCNLDAGWFGDNSKGLSWVEQRGDWDIVNPKRFPNGLKALADAVYAHGMKFGIWCEIEAIGTDAHLNLTHPEFVARRDGKSMGYICFGNPSAVKWAFEVLEKLIVVYHALWIKLDFNLSLYAGCNCTDHGHGLGDGLYEHYKGYYRLLDSIREKYPEVLLENCSSGGFRVDLGMMSHMHRTFLSDMDYPENAFQVFWGATSMLHPSACLHWMWSQTENGYDRNGDNTPIKENMPISKLDYIVRNAMLKPMGLSWKLSDIPIWCRKRIKEHFDFYKQTITEFIQDGELYRLSNQALRTGLGDRWNFYQYQLPEKNKGLLFIFRLSGSEECRKVTLKAMSPDIVYTLEDWDTGEKQEMSGEQLMINGIVIHDLPEESSRILIIRL